MNQEDKNQILVKIGAFWVLMLLLTFTFLRIHPASGTIIFFAFLSYAGYWTFNFLKAEEKKDDKNKEENKEENKE